MTLYTVFCLSSAGRSQVCRDNQVANQLTFEGGGGGDALVRVTISYFS